MKPLFRLPSERNPRGVEPFYSPGEAWRGRKSRLTPTGAPYEWVFTSHDASPRATYEVAPPEVPFASRFERAAAALEEGEPTIVERLFQLGRPREEEAPGVIWLGARGEGLHPRKLYVGVTAIEEVRTWAGNFLGQDTLISACAHRPRIVGYEPRSGRLEFYYRLEGFEEWHIPLLLRRCGLGSNAGNFCAILAALMGRPLEDNLPRRAGFSFSAGLGGGIYDVAFHFMAWALVGRDRLVYSRLVSQLTSGGEAWKAYERYAAPLVELDPINPYHNILSFALTPRREIVVAIGVAPLEYTG